MGRSQTTENERDYAEFCSKWHGVTTDGEGTAYYLRLRAGTSGAKRVLARLDPPWNTPIDFRQEVEKKRRTVPGEAVWIEAMLTGGTTPLDVIRLAALPVPEGEEEESGVGIQAKDPWSTIAFLAGKLSDKDDNAHDRKDQRIEHLESEVLKLVDKLVTVTGEAVGGKVLLDWIEKYGTGSETVKVLRELPLKEIAEGFKESMRARREKREREHKKQPNANAPAGDAAASSSPEATEPEDIIDRLLTEIVEITQKHPAKVWARRKEIAMFVKSLEGWAKEHPDEWKVPA